MKKVLILLMMMLGIIQAHAKEAYAVFYNGTLTLYYDEARSSRSGTIYDVPNGSCYLPTPFEWISGNVSIGHPWLEKADETNTIVFDPSFVQYTPISTYGWFINYKATEIQGLEYLNTSKTTDLSYMFAGCKNLSKLDLTNLIIAENAESQHICDFCSGLESISLGESISHLGTMAFKWCSSLRSIVIPKGVTKIGECIFYEDRNLTTIIVDEGNPNYDSRGGCNAIIKTATNELIYGASATVIPNGIVTIGSGAFSDLTLQEINIPNSVSQIKGGAFSGVRGITEITIPNSVVEIGSGAFNISQLTTVNSLIEHPFPIPSNCFSDKTKQNGTLNIPYGTMSLYEACDGWKDFANIVDPSGEKKKELYVFFKDSVLTYCYDSEKANREGEILELYMNGSTGDYGDLRVNIDWNRKDEIKKVVFLPSFAVIKPQSLKGLFLYLTKLSEIEGLEYLNTSEVTNMSNMFNGCAVTSLDVSHFNTSNVTDMSSMFSGCSSLTSLDLSNFNTSNVTNMRGMFNSCRYLTSIDVSNFNTDNVTNMSSMFSSCSSLTSLDVSNFNTSNVTDMSRMFYYCSSLTSLDVSHFNTSNVIDMSEMFRSCDGFTSIDINSFNTSNVTNMRGMFNSCRYLTSIDVSNFNTDNVTNMSSMFSSCSSLTSLDFSSFNTSNVGDMMDMITSCRNLQTIKLGARFIPKSGFYKFNTPTEDSALSTIISLNENPTNIASDCFPDKVKNTALLLVPKGTVDKYKSADGWREFASIIDEQEDIYGVFKDGILTIYSDGKRNEKDGDVYDVPDKDNRYGWAVIKKDIKTFIIDSSLASVYPINLNVWFRESYATSISGFENLSVSGSLSRVFFGCSGLETLDLSKLNTENVKDMSELFVKCDRLKELNLSNFNTSKVTDMSDMFSSCRSLTSLDVSNFNTSKVTDMSSMFLGCRSLTSLDVSNFNTSNVTNMYSMFRDCGSLTSLDLSNFNTSKVTNMRSMFDYCISLTSLDLSNFNTSKVTDMSSMFRGCKSLTSLDVSNFNTSKGANMWGMFSSCSALKSFVIPNTFTLIGICAFEDCSSLEKVTIPNTVKSIGQNAFYNCVSLKEVICNIEEPFAINENAFMNKADGTEVFTSAILTVPQGTKELYQNTDGWKEFAHITDEEGIAPIDTSDNVDYGNGGGINGDTDLNGNVVGNIYYNISDDNGEYSSTEGCIILKKPTSDTDMNNLEGQDIFGEDFKNGFTGIVFMVQAGSGTVKVNAETVGNMTLNVKFGNNAPVTMELEGKMKASFPYSVSEPTYVYIYGGETQTANARGLRAASSNNALKIYGIEWSEEASSIESIYGVSNADAVIYNLQGQRLQTVTKGINIVNGKKVIVK